jgi:hypothetical protein
MSLVEHENANTCRLRLTPSRLPHNRKLMYNFRTPQCFETGPTDGPEAWGTPGIGNAHALSRNEAGFDISQSPGGC